MSIATSALYLWHILVQLRGHHDLVSLLGELLLYNVVAAVTGALSEGQIRARRELERASHDLERSYQTLRVKTGELVAAEEQLRQSDRLRLAGELAAGVAHEVRNPLGGILGAAEILSRSGTSPDTRQEFAGVLSREIQRLDRVIGEFLEYARPGSEVAGDASVADVSRSVLRLLEPALRRGRIDVDERHAAALLVRADAERLQQVLLNLILNGIQAMERGGRLTIESSAEGALAEIRVRDTGGGVPESIRDRLFEPFITGRSGGTGLGLSISSRIVQGLGGQLSLESTGAAGTTFLLVLPAAGEATRGGD